MPVNDDITELKLSSESHRGTLTSHGKRITKLERSDDDHDKAIAKMDKSLAVMVTKLNVVIGILSVIGVAVAGAVVKYLST